MDKQEQYYNKFYSRRFIITACIALVNLLLFIINVCTGSKIIPSEVSNNMIWGIVALVSGWGFGEVYKKTHM